MQFPGYGDGRGSNHRSVRGRWDFQQVEALWGPFGFRVVGWIRCAFQILTETNFMTWTEKDDYINDYTKVPLSTLEISAPLSLCKNVKNTLFPSLGSLPRLCALVTKLCSSGCIWLSWLLRLTETVNHCTCGKMDVGSRTRCIQVQVSSCSFDVLLPFPGFLASLSFCSYLTCGWWFLSPIVIKLKTAMLTKHLA